MPSPVKIAPAGKIADVDSSNLASMTVTLTNRPDGNAVRSLSLNSAARRRRRVTWSYTASTGVLAISGTASVATYQTILQASLAITTARTPTPRRAA